ncbi:MAG: septation protein SepH, partial [Nocardioidaceae bacterium]
RYVVPEDDEARGLVGEQTTKPAPRSGGQRASSPRRLSAVSTEDELPLGTDAIEMVADDSGRGTGARADDERTVDLSPAARAVRERPATGDRASDPAVPTGDADWMATQASDRPAVRPAVTPVSGATDSATEPASAPSVPVEEHQVAEEREDATPKKGGRKGRRASVPSWDEIMFGGGRSE